MAKKTTATSPKASTKAAPAPTPAAKPARKTAAAKAAPPPPPAKAAVITLKQLAIRFGESHDVPPKQAQAMLDSVVGLLVEHLKAGDKLRLNGLGILEVKDRPARTGRNPATGAPVQIAASKKIAFRASKDLKDAI